MQGRFYIHCYWCIPLRLAVAMPMGAFQGGWKFEDHATLNHESFFLRIEVAL